ncbi:hypothetical protein HHI36_022533 [Cryptolaemus montrouzieri]|uniref:Uncharacterized protein n=1 Tax=Cryptolaemus montrouzieri TaxID=559131 RepID=A0ABD2N0R1_9CUCU
MLAKARMVKGAHSMIGVDGRDMCQDDDIDRAMIRKYHPKMSEEEKDEYENYQRNNWAMENEYDRDLTAGEIENTIKKLKVKRACGDDRSYIVNIPDVTLSNDRFIISLMITKMYINLCPFVFSPLVYLRYCTYMCIL